ncbi:hypothetical protein FIBSPDRAFT_890240 [Athelia psychrophila]|uniref:Uncharacterized protein n=1 Tax=Athelia psychrophila TaxID=1759441 RepID=A0A166L5R0_9AGAM|nr:hypothetical protein FIBSPDRAFT_890240 [Fibularhizoctonia sp. CBS 109695]
MPHLQRPEALTGMTGAHYSSLFDSGLRAMSAHSRTLPLPLANALPLHPFPSRSPVNSTFWSSGGESDEELEPRSPSSGLSCDSSSTVTGAPDSERVLMIKGVPLLFGMSRNLSSDVSSSLPPSSRCSCLDPLALSSRWSSTDYDASSNTDSFPISPVDFEDDSFLSLTISTQPSTRRCSISSQNPTPYTKSPSQRGSWYSLTERTHLDTNDDHWMYEFEADLPSDPSPKYPAEKSPVEAPRWENDWRAFHTHYIKESQEAMRSSD